MRIFPPLGIENFMELSTGNKAEHKTQPFHFNIAPASHPALQTSPSESHHLEQS